MIVRQCLWVVAVSCLVSGCLGSFADRIPLDPTTVEDLRRQVPVYSESDTREYVLACSPSVRPPARTSSGSRTDPGGGDRSVTGKGRTPRRQRPRARGMRGIGHGHDLREQTLLGMADVPRHGHPGDALNLRYLSAYLLRWYAVMDTIVLASSNALRMHWRGPGRPMQSLRNVHHTVIRRRRSPSCWGLFPGRRSACGQATRWSFWVACPFRAASLGRSMGVGGMFRRRGAL